MPGAARISSPGTDDGEDVDQSFLPPDFDPNVPYVAYSTLDSKRLSLSSLGNVARNRKKKRLVIKGIQIHETRKFEAVKQWCEVSRPSYTLTFILCFMLMTNPCHLPELWPSKSDHPHAKWGPACQLREC